MPPLRCLLGIHYDELHPTKGRLDVVCADCGRVSRGIDVGRMPPPIRLAGRPDRMETIAPQLQHRWLWWVSGEHARELGRVV